MADKRFTALSTDPRYRLPNRKESRTAVDPRFKRLFTDQDFQQKATVDRYGRKIQSGAGKEKLEKLYRLDKPDVKKKQSKKVEREVVGSSDEDSEDNAEDEELVEKRDPARDGGFSESSSEEEDSSSGEESEDEAALAEETAGREQTESVPMGEVSRRLAVVNIDWDNIRAVDIMAVASSFAPTGGGIENVAIYPSEFGKERMEREELEGPPREIFASSKRTEEETSDDDEDYDDDDDEKIKKQLQQQQVSEGQEFDTAKLRQYQLDRLRYFYAVITCNSETTAKALYDNMDTREYLTSSNFFDLRFIPEGTSFDDDQPRDECSQLPAGYKPNDFRTEALTHSKVRLTWDDDDTTRKEVQKRAFSRAEIDENDLQAYIGSDSSDAESVSSKKSSAEERKLSKKAAEKAKMRAALGLPDEPTRAPKKNGKDEVVGDMQITFTSGLGAKDASSGVFENEPQDEESTRARYIRKEKERKQKRKEKMKTARSGAGDADADSDVNENAVQDQGFDDPFFNDPAAAAAAEKKAKKADREKKRSAQAEKDSESAAQRAQLDLLMADEKGETLRHFDMREIEKAQKRKNKKHKKKKVQEEDAEILAKDTFQVETQDPRFKALFESHEYAIDPTNPRFKGTDGMKALLEEGRKKRKFVDDEGDARDTKQTSKPSSDDKSDLKGLVARLKDGKKAKR